MPLFAQEAARVLRDRSEHAHSARGTPDTGQSLTWVGDGGGGDGSGSLAAQPPSAQLSAAELSQLRLTAEDDTPLTRDGDVAGGSSRAEAAALPLGRCAHGGHLFAGVAHGGQHLPNRRAAPS